MEFKQFKGLITEQVNGMQANLNDLKLFRSSVDKDLLWETYLASFPEGTNPMFRERTEHDCQHCKSFIRAIGGMVGLSDHFEMRDDYELVTIWDIETGSDTYQPVVDALAALVRSYPIQNIFLHTEKQVHIDNNVQLLGDGKTIKWEHLYTKLKPALVKTGDDIGTALGEAMANKSVMLRGLDELTTDAVETVLELIDQNSLYRGEENKALLTQFLACKVEYDDLEGGDEVKDRFAWLQSRHTPILAKIRNTAIGTLLVNLSEGKDLEYSVKAFETMVAPANYRRPTAVITPRMIKNAEEKVKELGFISALGRRYSTIRDITINNILFADRSAKKEMNAFDALAADVTTKFDDKKLSKVEQITIENFIKNVLPTADKIEIGIENKHVPNFVSLISPTDPESKTMFKWGNNLSWAYNGDMADSIKERVKNAGGNVEGDLRCSLAWSNKDDLDIHMICPAPTKAHIYYGNKNPSVSTGRLDVDMNAGRTLNGVNPVENITFQNRSQIQEGEYVVEVHNYRKRSSENVGFTVEMEFNGVITTFHHQKAVPDGKSILVLKFNFTHKDGVKIIESIPSEERQKEIWGVKTQTFQRVKVIMNSPNHWDGENTGNKHYFFIMEGCLQEGSARGFFNEFLIGDLNEHRKVFEVLGSKMKTEPSEEQLSGLGFSSTQRNSVFCKVTGSFTRTVEIIF